LFSLVPTPIGNIGDISLRAIEALSEADILLCEDTRVTKKLIHILKERYNTSFKENQEFISLHSHNEKSFIEKLESSFFEQNIVYVSDAGMPGISDPGQMLVRYCIDNNIAYDVFPGANALLTAFVASGFIETQMLFFGFLGEFLPIAVLAGVIMYVGFGMINFNLFNWLIYNKSRLDGLIALIVFVATVSIDLVSAVGIGIILSMIMHIRAQIKTSIIHAERDGTHRHSLVFRTDKEERTLEKNGNFIKMLELKGNLTFATSDQLLQYSEKYFKKNQFLILNFLRVQSVDITGVILILQIASRMKNAGGKLILCHMHKDLGMGKKVTQLFRGDLEGIASDEVIGGISLFDNSYTLGAPIEMAMTKLMGKLV